ncbi:MAG: hypothetical protein RL033_3849 [Pseudomonadota bacterium]|jgi:hypothetical protein
MRGALWLTWTALAVFAVAMVVAMALYPGGSWTERESIGFSFWRNFWCDLVRSQAINGADNGLSRSASSLAFAALALSLWGYWRVATSQLAEPLRFRLLVLGRAATVGLLATALLPSDVHPVVHGVVALSSGTLGMSSTALCIAPLRRGESRWSVRRCLGGSALLLAAGNAALYIHVAYAGGPETLAQPSVQKLATLALLAWMVSTLRGASGMATEQQ